jgi:hypothetical protein
VDSSELSQVIKPVMVRMELMHTIEEWVAMYRKGQITATELKRELLKLGMTEDEFNRTVF